MTHLKNDDRRQRSDLKLSNTQDWMTAHGRQQNRRTDPVLDAPGDHMSPSSGANTSHMLSHRTSTQRHRATATSLRRRRVSAPLRLVDGRREKEAGGSGLTLSRAASAPVIVNQTKLAIVAVMQELDRPVTSIELQMIWAEEKAQEIFEYHLCTLVKAEVVEVAYGPELHFRLTTGSQGPESLLRERCH